VSEYKQVFETILAKLDAETRLRDGRDLEAWIAAERACVWREVNRLRELRGWSQLSMCAIERAERLAVGHSDYVRKYAHAAADLVLREVAWK
jgi:hypothetical protein